MYVSFLGLPASNTELNNPNTAQPAATKQETAVSATTPAASTEQKATTLAVGEEGGSGGITSTAVGEEGGDPSVPPVSTDTQDYVMFLREADYYGTRNEQMTRQEAQAHVDRYQNQISMLRTFSDFYSRFFPPIAQFFDSMIQKLDAKVKVGNRFLTHFDKFASGNPYDRNTTDVSIWDVRFLAARDWRPSDVSDTDLGLVFLK